MRRRTLAAFGSGVGLPGYRVEGGGVSTLVPGEVSHDEGPHTHPDPEIFLILSGSGRVHIDGTAEDFSAGDVLIVEAGEDHHLEAVSEVVTTWLHLEPVDGVGAE
ncbi:cupin domain-containing protein [Planotetraspora sp. A-T 1434]|uniref:cupin domain-containing protein n=1 Tax=Planotetraspora sp. A-T 1434 TaxID=2979219 RepID=UPI0021BE4611|nr:cupin domain-containing protein [Planotetraspora sp. A-T 1434]MCT9930352.1 cupin domain-containing protein [Planotetraspora sp. A-T 1434]